MIAVLMSLAPQLSIETTWRVLAELLACAYYSPPIWLLTRQSIHGILRRAMTPVPHPFIVVGGRLYSMLERAREQLADSPSSLEAIKRAEQMAEFVIYARTDRNADWDARYQQLIEIGKEPPFEVLLAIIGLLQTWRAELPRAN
jgi:hypothetical protein